MIQVDRTLLKPFSTVRARMIQVSLPCIVDFIHRKPIQASLLTLLPAHVGLLAALAPLACTMCNERTAYFLNKTRAKVSAHYSHSQPHHVLFASPLVDRESVSLQPNCCFRNGSCISIVDPMIPFRRSTFMPSSMNMTLTRNFC